MALVIQLFDGWATLGYFIRIIIVLLFGNKIVILLIQQEKIQGIASLYSDRKQVKHALLWGLHTLFLLETNLLPPILSDPIFFLEHAWELCIIILGRNCQNLLAIDLVKLSPLDVPVFNPTLDAFVIWYRAASACLFSQRIHACAISIFFSPD